MPFSQTRAHRAQSLNNIGNGLDDIINVLLGVLLAEGQAQRAVRDLVRQTDRHQNVGRVERTGGACRTGGAADARVIQTQDQALALDRLKDKRSARQTVYRIAGVVEYGMFSMMPLTSLSVSFLT